MAPTDNSEFLREVLDTSPTMIVVSWADPDRSPLFVSEEFERATGSALDLDAERLPDSYWERIHPDDRERQRAWRASYSEEHGAPPPIQYRFRTLDGWRWYSTAMSLFRPARDGEPAQVMLVTSDVTEVREAQDAQKATQDFYEQILGAAAVRVAVIDRATADRIYLSPALVRLLGFDADDFNAMPVDERWEFVHPDDRAAEQQRLAAVQSGELTDVGATHRIKTVDGWRWFKIDYTRLPDGPTAGLALQSFTDVHEQTEATRRRLSLLDGAPIPAAIRDLTADRLVYANRAWTEATGYDVESFENAHPGDPLAFVHPDDRDAVIQAGASRGGVKPYSARFRGPDGEYRWYQTNITRLDRTAGDAEEALFFHTDITELIEFQARSDVMVERNPVAQVVFDLDSNVIEFANHALFELSGRTLDEWNDLGPPHIRAERIGTPPEDYAAIFDAIDQALETGEVTSVRRRWLHADGTTRWLECRYRSFPDPLRPRARRVLMAAADITEQVGTEVQRAALLETAPVLVTITDTSTGQREYVSPEFTRVTGYTLDEYNALSRDEQVARVHPDDRDRVNAEAEAFQSTGGERGEEITYRLRTVDGWRWITTRARILSTKPDGSAARLMVSGVDVNDAIEADAFRTAVLDGSPTGITVYDLRDDRPEFVNAEFTALTGYRIEDIDKLGPRAVEAMVPAEDLASMIDLSLDAFRGGTVAEVRHRIRHLDGSIAWYASRFNRVDAGEGPKLLISSIAVTEQMEAERRSQAILDASPFSVVIHEADSSSTEYVNPTYSRITGFTAAELTEMDRDGPHSIAAEDAPKENAAIDRAIASGRPASALIRVATADGGYRWMDSWYVSYPDLEGRFPRRVLITSLDVTDRLDAEAQSQTILETSPSIVLVFDPDEVITEFANPTFTRVTGYTADQLNAVDRTTVPSLVHPDDLPAEERAIDAAVSTGRPVSLTHRLLTTTGEYRWLDTQYQHFPDASGLRPRRILITSIDVTDRINAEALSESLVNASPIGLLVYDTESEEYEWTNPAFVTLTGFTADELNERGRHTRPVLTVPEDMPAENNAIDEAVTSGRQTEVRHRFRCFDGTVRSFESRFTALPHPDGSGSNRVLVSSIDITDRLETELRERAILAASPAMILVVDLTNQQVLYANDAYRRLNQLPASWPQPDDPPLIGASIPDEDRVHVNEAVSGTLRDGRPRIVSHRYRSGAGDMRNMQSHVSSFPDPVGGDLRLAVTSIDITERVEAQALSETVLASSPAPTVVVDASDGSTVYANPAFTAATGHTAESLNAMPFDEMLGLTPDDERALVDQAIDQTIATGEVTSAERTYRGADGVVRWFDSRFLRLPTSSGEEVVITAIDTTVRRQAEIALEAERARLERANRDLQEFVYIASHDLQEPLRTLSAYSQLLGEELPGDVSEDARMSVRFINEGAGRMRDLVQALLEYSRIGRDHEVAPVAAGSLVDAVTVDLGDQIGREGASVTASALPTVLADATQLRLVFQNLVSNAIKFRSPDRPPQVEIAADDLGDEWRFTVRDNGIGIADKHVDRIFAIFQRLHSRSAYEGTGIGLAHAKRAVQNHGGTLGVDSEEGVGSTFWFTIPKEPDS